MKTEIAPLLRTLGLEEDASSFELTQLFRESDESGFEAKAKEAIAQLEDHFADQPEILDRIQTLKQKSFNSELLIRINSEDQKFTFALLDIASDMIKRRNNLANKIEGYENLQFKEFYEMDAASLKATLEQYQKQFKLPHFRITKKDLENKFKELANQKQREDYRLLLEEKEKILEMAAAYKFNNTFESQTKNLELQLEKAEIERVGLNQLFKALNHLTRVSASYSEGAAASQKLKELKNQAKEKTEEMSVMEARQKVLDEKIILLNGYYSKQADLNAAEAMAGLMEQVKEFQSAFI